MVPTRYERFFAFLKKGVWRSCAAVGLNRERRCQRPAENTCRLREGANRRDGSFTRQRSTISLNAREYLCTPPSRSRVGGAPCTLSTDGIRLVSTVESMPQIRWNRAERFGKRGNRIPRKRDTITHICKSTVREDSRDRGARPCASSRAVIPKDQISALESY
jgi:hypothetical protein